MIDYTFVNQKYYRDNQEITKEQAIQELGAKVRYNWLIKTGRCSIRESTFKKVMGNIDTVNDTVKLPKGRKIVDKKLDKQQKELEKLYQQNKDDYRIEHTTYAKLGPKIELWRKNKKYGYYNFATYLVDESEETIKNAIVTDIQNQAQLVKTKKNKQVTEDDDV